MQIHWADITRIKFNEQKVIVHIVNEKHIDLNGASVHYSDQQF